MAKRVVPPIATCVYNSTQTATLQPKSNPSKQRKEREKLEKREDKSSETSAGNSARNWSRVLDVRGTLGDRPIWRGTHSFRPRHHFLSVSMLTNRLQSANGVARSRAHRGTYFKTELKPFRNWLLAFSNTPCTVQTNYLLKYARFEWLDTRLGDKPGVGIRRVGDATPDWVKRGYLCCTLRNN